MNELKEANTSVDAERVVSDLLDALKSLKTQAPRPRSASGEEGRQRAPQSQHGRSKAFEVVGENSDTPEHQIGSSSTIEGFCPNHGIVERLQLTSQELQALSNASLLGTATCTQDVMFILRKLREAGTSETGTSEELEASIAPERIGVEYPAGNGSSHLSANEDGETAANDY